MNAGANVPGQRSIESSIFVLVTCLLLFTINYMDRAVLSATLPLIKTDLGLTDAEAGWLGTAYFLMVALLTIPSAILVDRWSRKKSLSLMAVIWSVATWFTGAGKSLGQLLVARGFVGIGEAGFAPGGMTYVSASFSEKRRGLVLGIFTLGAALGNILGLLLASHFAKANVMGLGWRAPFYFFAIPGVLLGILILFTKDYTSASPSETSASKTGSIWQDALSIIKTPTFSFVALAMAFGTVAVTGALQFFPMYLMRSRGLDVTQASSVFAVLCILTIPGVVLTGAFADWVHKRKSNGRVIALFINTSIGMVAVVLALILDGMHYFNFALIPYALFFVLAGSQWSVAASALQGLFALRFRSLTMGLLILCTYIFGGFGPYVLGKLSDELGTLNNPDLGNAFWLFPLSLLLSAFFTLLGARTYDKDMSKSI